MFPQVKAFAKKDPAIENLNREQLPTNPPACSAVQGLPPVVQPCLGWRACLVHGRGLANMMFATAGPVSSDTERNFLSGC